jgi:hypothetical protein
MGKMDIRKLFIWPNSRNKSNSNYHGKICQHLPLPLNQKPRHLNLPLRLSPPRVIPIKMLKRKSTMLTRGRCFKPMPLKFKLCKMNSNHWGPNFTNLKGKSSQSASHAQPVQGSGSWEGPLRLFYSLSHDAMVGEYVFSNAHNSNLTPKFATSFALLTLRHKRLMWHPEFLPLGK